MKYYQITSSFVLIFLLGLVLPAQPQAAAVEELVAEALAANPEIAASKARWQMFVHQAAQAGSLEDPMVMLGIDSGLVRDPLNLDRDMETARVIGVSQMLPWFGKRALARQAADHQAEAARWEVEERRLELAAMVRETWYRLYLADRSLELLDRGIATLDDLVRATEALYAVGQGRQADVLRAQVEFTRMTEMRLTLQQQRRSLEAGLNTLLFRPVAATIAPAGGVELTPLALDGATLERLAEEQRPLLRALAARIDQATAERALAEKEYYPDVTLSFEYMQREPVMDDPGYDMYNASLSFNLPVQRERRRAMVAEREAARWMAREELAMTRNTLRRTIAELLSQLERDRAMAELYREALIPQAAAAEAAALAAYRSGQGEFMQVLDSRMALFNVERGYHQAVAEYQMELASLEAVVGGALGAAGMVEQQRQ